MKLLFRILLILLVGCLLAEATARFNLGERRPERAELIPQDLRDTSQTHGIDYVNKANAEAWHQYPSDPFGTLDIDEASGKHGVRYRLNNLGLRGPDTTLAKPAGTFRILVLGDSIAFGGGVRQADIATARLQAALDERAAKAGTELHYEVLNLGVPGLNTYFEAKYLQKRGVEFEPDVVLILHTLDDANRTKLREWVDQRVSWVQYPVWRQHSVLLDRIAAYREARAGAVRTFANVRMSYDPQHRSWIRAQRALGRIVDLGRARGFRVGVAINPVLWQLDPYPLAEIHTRIAASFEERGAAVLDLASAFRGRPAADYWVHPKDPRPNSLGQQVMADALVDFLAENGLLEPAPPEAGPQP